jgi:hypothetical protein
MTTEPIDLAKWIQEENLPWTTGDFKSLGCTIGQCIPPNYEAYCKIFHPFEITPDEPDILAANKEYGQNVSLKFSRDNDNNLSISEIRPDGSAVNVLELQKERLAEHNSKHWNFASWKTIADKYSLIFHNEITLGKFIEKFQEIGWPKNLSFPSEGYLPRQLLINLIYVLNSSVTGEPVYIYQIPPHTAFKNNKHFDLVKCSLDEVLEYFDNGFVGYLYASDKSWIVFTDTDLSFTIVGGQKELIEKLKNSSLEVLECLSTTRVDIYGDKLNEDKAKGNSSLPKERRNWWQKLFGAKVAKTRDTRN